MTRSHGLTLIELLCCLVVVALLTACAVPLHREAMQRVRRSDARQALLHLEALEERHLFFNGRYAASLAELSGATPLERSDAGFYHLEVRARAGDAGFLAVATPSPEGPQAMDTTCRRLWLDDQGHRSAEGSADAALRCWS